MRESKKIIRVFLASPGDLRDERQIVRDEILELNSLWAKALGFEIELLGYEDTAPGAGRPQAIINEDLDKCELFIGLLYKRWGSPPDNEGKYDSGFQEEYIRALEAYKESKAPIIWMFLKEIPENSFHDIGPQLQKVIDFKAELIDRKEVLFKEFSSGPGLAELLKTYLCKYLTDLDENVSSLSTIDHSKTGSIEHGGEPISTNTIFSVEGTSFLRSFIDRAGEATSLEGIDATEVARFRLISNVIEKSANDAPDIGVHNLNLLYANKQNIEFGSAEINCLSRIALRELKTEVVPFWHWFSLNKNFETLVRISMYSPDERERVNSISVLEWMKFVISEDRDTTISMWLADNASDAIKLAAVKYLAYLGKDEDLETVEKQFKEASFGNRSKMMELLFVMKSRLMGVSEATQFSVQTNFKAGSKKLIELSKEGLSIIPDEVLRRALTHENADLREEALQIAIKKGLISKVELERAKEDSSSKIRLLAWLALEEQGTVEPFNAVKAILIRKSKTTIFGASSSSADGSLEFEEYKILKLKKLPKHELALHVENDWLLENNAYLVQAEKYASTFIDILRKNIDDKFKEYLSHKMEVLRETPGSDLAVKAETLLESLGDSLTREGLSILSRLKNYEDLPQVRALLFDSEIGILPDDLSYLSKFGDWSDIPSVAKAAPYYGGPSVLLYDRKTLIKEKAETIYQLGSQDVNRLLLMDISEEVKAEILRIMSSSKIKELEVDTLKPLLLDSLVSLRKVCAIRLAQAQSISFVSEVLDGYINGEDYRFYNVIYWLDLKVSMPKRDSSNIYRKQLESMEEG